MTVCVVCITCIFILIIEILKLLQPVIHQMWMYSDIVLRVIVVNGFNLPITFFYKAFFIIS